ncbi:hypothetical protein MMA231_04149 (plasmid) [Asticcacaulis sp. MM231]|uniref:acyltransferase family protein n=1 Tax=Asticcacaulis sp. MM231 TaxID=3157666 RepID=UPI0032D594BB
MSEQKPQRVTWVDLARGVGILLVVIGHAAGGIIDSPLGAQASGIRYVFLTIYTFHMPLFFILSGLFIAERLKADPKKFVTNTFTKIARAYFTWAIIQFTVIYMMGSLLNHPATGGYLQNLVAIIWAPVSQFWFLYALFFMQIAAWMIVPRTGATGFFALATVVYLAFETFGVPEAMNYPPVGQFCTFIISFGIGVAVGPHLSRIKVLHNTSPVLPALAFIAWLGLYYLGYVLASQKLGADWVLRSQGAEIAYSVNKIMFYPAGLAGTAMVILACCANIIPLRPVFEYLGKHSMPIFLTHILFIAGTRIVLLKIFGTLDATLLLVIISIVGTVGSLVFFEIMKRLKLTKALALI